MNEKRTANQWTGRLIPLACSVEDCEHPVHAQKLCDKHYQRLRNTGSITQHIRTVEERFWVKVDKNGPIPVNRPDLGPCWIWTGATVVGYGNFYVGDGRWEVAHRVAYKWIKGPIPEGTELDHLCHNRPCMNPEHTEAVTHQVNVQRGDGPAATADYFAAQTHCKAGHTFNESNTYITKNGYRVCRRCQNNWQKEYVARRATGA